MIATGARGSPSPGSRANVDPKAERVPMAPKLKYVMPLDKKLRRELQALAQPYPKTAAEVTPGDTPCFPPGEAGSRPSRPLHPAAC